MQLEPVKITNLKGPRTAACHVTEYVAFTKLRVRWPSVIGPSAKVHRDDH